MARAAAEVDELDCDQDLTGACLRCQGAAAVPGSEGRSCMSGAVLLTAASLIVTGKSTEGSSDWLSVTVSSLSAASACRAAVQSPACMHKGWITMKRLDAEDVDFRVIQTMDGCRAAGNCLRPCAGSMLCSPFVCAGTGRHLVVLR